MSKRGIETLLAKSWTKHLGRAVWPRRRNRHPGSTDSQNDVAPPPSSAVGDSLRRPLHRFAHVEPPPPGCLLLDCRIVEMSNAERGISRYVQGLGKALLAQRPDAVRFLFSEETVPSYFRLSLDKKNLFTITDLARHRESIAYFIQGCHFLLHVNFDALYPPQLQEMGCWIGAIFYDAIPWRMPRDYLRDQQLYAAYYAKLDALRDCDLLFAISQHAADEARNILGLPTSQVVFLGGGVDPDRWPRPAPQRPPAVPDGPYWLCVGGTDRRKNLHRLFAGYALYAHRSKNPKRLVVACALREEDARDLRCRIEALGLSAERDIVLTGYVSDAELARLYTDCDAVVLPSIMEGLGLPILEAYHFGKLAIGSDTSALRELLPPACRFDPFRPEAIAEAMLRLEEQQIPLDDARVFARRILEDYSWDKAAERLLSALADRGITLRGPSEDGVRPISLSSLCPLPELGQDEETKPTEEPSDAIETAAETRSAFVSYAQNFEDIVLWRVLGDVTPGRYIDIGAQDPCRNSVSLGFYERGWRGVHVEPVAHYADALRAARPDELVIEAAVAAKAGHIQFHEFADTGLSTGIAEIAERYIASGREAIAREVRAMTLDDVFDLAGPDPVHWLKIDVEGMEAEVLTGWRGPQRPWVVVIEDTLPTDPSRRFGACDTLLEAKGYRRCLFDGLNSFWIHQDHAARATRLEYGVSLWDDAVLSEPSYVPIARHLMERLLFARRDALTARRNALEEKRKALALEEKLTRTATMYAELTARHNELAAQYSEASRALADARAELHTIYASRSWRLTAPLRSVNAILGRHLRRR